MCEVVQQVFDYCVVFFVQVEVVVRKVLQFGGSLVGVVLGLCFGGVDFFVVFVEEDVEGVGQGDGLCLLVGFDCLVVGVQDWQEQCVQVGVFEQFVGVILVVDVFQQCCFVVVV